MADLTWKNFNFFTKLKEESARVAFSAKLVSVRGMLITTWTRNVNIRNRNGTGPQVSTAMARAVEVISTIKAGLFGLIAAFVLSIQLIHVFLWHQAHDVLIFAGLRAGARCQIGQK